MAAAFLVGAHQGEALWTLNTLTRLVATASSTGGALGVWEQRVTPAGNSPLHVHQREDEAFYILEGRVTFEIGGERLQASAGDFVFAPRQSPHRFAVDWEGAACSCWWSLAGSSASSLTWAVPPREAAFPRLSSQTPQTWRAPPAPMGSRSSPSRCSGGRRSDKAAVCSRPLAVTLIAPSPAPQAANSADKTSACSRTVRVACSCLSGG